MKFFLIAALLLSTFFAFGQDKLEHVDVEQIMIEVGKSVDAQNFKEVIAQLESIPKNDSIYCNSLVSKTYYLMQDEQYDQIDKVYEEAQELNCKEDLKSINLNRSVAYLRDKNNEASLDVSEAILKDNPFNTSAMKNKALALFRLEKYMESAEVYKKIIRVHPFDEDAHLQLGVISYRRGLSAQALMCFNMYLLLNDNLEDSQSLLKGLNDLSFNLYKERKLDYVVSEEDADFKTIDQILDQRIALQDSYETGHKVDLPFIRQSHILFTYLKDHKGKYGLWSEIYAPLFGKLINNDQFEDYIYYITQALKGGDYKSLYKRNEDSALETAQAIVTNYLKLSADFNPGSTYHYSNGKMSAIGDKVDNDEPIGFYKLYDTYGYLSESGSFNESHNRDGIWKSFYTDGAIKETQEYVNGKKQGLSIGYYPNGVKSFQYMWNDDVATGVYNNYTKSGALKIDKELTNSENDGYYKGYFDVGESILEYKATYKANFIEGTLYEYYSNGEVYQETTYANQARNGSQVTYDIDGNSIAKVNYVDDFLDGDYKTFYSNGNPEIEASLKEDVFVGNYVSFHSNGNPYLKMNYNDDGELDGLYQEFARDGKLWYEFDYINSKIKRFRYFDKSGAIIHEGKKQGGDLDYKGYTSDRILFVEGTYDVRDGKTGIWKFYDTNTGALTSMGNYVEDKAMGALTLYYPNGNVQEVTEYDNDVPVGYSVYYYPNNEIKSQGYFKDGERHGNWEWYHVDGTLESRTYFNKGTIINSAETFDASGSLENVNVYDNGELKEEKYYAADGTLKQLFSYPLPIGKLEHKVLNDKGSVSGLYTYLNGMLNGPTERYSKGNKVILKGEYLNGQSHGLWQGFFPNGKVEFETTYNMGNTHGVRRGYYENGQLEYEYEDRNNLSQGPYVSYWENGSINSENLYVDGKIQGARKQYDEEGNLQIIRYYDYGLFIGYAYEDKNGEIVPMIPVERETGKIVAYYKNGQVSRKFEMNKGDFIGTYEIYHPNGKLMSKTPYKNGWIDGTDEEYYSDGTIKSITPYLMNQIHGSNKSYHDNGNLKLESNFLNGVKHGKSSTYDSDGKLIKTEEYLNGQLQF
jgi:antitoxin component YwqK of YwqJK toxin-antitoxin module